MPQQDQIPDRDTPEVDVIAASQQEEAASAGEEDRIDLFPDADWLQEDQGLEQEAETEVPVQEEEEGQPATPERLYAGKYRTVEDMERAYEEAQRGMHDAKQEAAAYRNVLEAPRNQQQQQQMPGYPPPSTPEEPVEFNPYEIDNPASASTNVLARAIAGNPQFAQAIGDVVQQTLQTERNRMEQTRLIQQQEDALRRHLSDDRKLTREQVDQHLDDLRQWARNPSNVDLTTLYKLRHIEDYMRGVQQQVETRFTGPLQRNAQASRGLVGTPAAAEKVANEEEDFVNRLIRSAQSMQIPFE